MNHRADLLGILQAAKTVPQLGSFLARLLTDRVIASVFLLHRDELFQRQYFREQGVTIPLGTSGLPLMSHRAVDLRTSFERHVEKVSAYVPRWFQGEAERLLEQIEEATAERPIDAIVVALLNTVRQNASLRYLVNGDERVTHRTLRTKIRTYESLSFDGIEEDWAKAVSALMGGHAGRAMRDIFLHADLLKGMIDLERFRFALLQRTILHWESLLPARKVKDVDWRRTILGLHNSCLVEHFGPLCMWCNRCGETGVTANVATSYVLHPVYCPRCRGPVHAVTTFAPIPPLRQALELQDGALGAAIGWWLVTHGIEFTASKDVAGYEIDFVIPVQDGIVMVECKMNHLLAKDRLMGKLYENRGQLRDHLIATRRDGVKARAAGCIVNLSAHELKGLVDTMAPESEPAFREAGGVLLSYEEAGDWLNACVAMR